MTEYKEEYDNNGLEVTCSLCGKVFKPMIILAGKPQLCPECKGKSYFPSRG